MAEKNLTLTKIKRLVTHAGKFKGMEFRMALEGLVKEGGKEAERMLVEFLTDANIVPETRMDIVRVAGYLQRPSFLIPLKKIIDTVQHSRIQQEAIISVSKFNDRRALNILNQSLQRINNPMLMSTINREIGRIKENNPILALMPRFQEGQKNPKTFKIALEILKRILTPEDATVFAKFLESTDPLICTGAFEILCIAGDVMHDSDILGYFQKKFETVTCIAEKECDELYMLTHHIKKYLTRYQFMIEEQVPNFKQQFLKAGDIRVRQLLISMICKSKGAEAIEFIQHVYPADDKVKPTIIDELAGNEATFQFLFSLYKGQDPLKTNNIRSLLSLEQGMQYFTKHFFSLPFEDQEIIVTWLPYSGQPELLEFVKKIFQADIYRLKEILMEKVYQNYEFSVKEILFAPEREREFHFMGKNYFNTITHLFPVSSVKRFLRKILEDDLSVSNSKKYLLLVAQVVPLELLLNFKDKEFIGKLFTKIINSNNKELSVLFLGILKFIKTLDIQTYRNINESMSLFITKRESNISPEERGELVRIKRSFHDLFLEFKRIDEGNTALDRLCKQLEVDFEIFQEALTTHRMALVMNNEPVKIYLTEQLQKCSIENIQHWTAFLVKFPKIAWLIKPAIQDQVYQNKGAYFANLLELVESFSDEEPRIVINFKNRHFTAVLREEFSEAVPHIKTIINDMEFNDSDTLLCDPGALQEIVLNELKLPPKTYLFLENLEGFAQFKDFNTKTFVHPFSFYRIVKEILREFYMP